MLLGADGSSRYFFWVLFVESNLLPNFVVC